MVSAANPTRVSGNVKKVGCFHADRPSGKSSVEQHSWDTCWQWLMRIPGKALISLALRQTEEVVSLLKDIYEIPALYMGL